MTTLHKTVLTCAVVLVAGAGVYETRQNFHGEQKQSLPTGTGGDLGTSVINGDSSALEKILALSKTEHEIFNKKSVGLNDTARGELAWQTFAPLRAAFDVINAGATNGNLFARNTLFRALQFKELKGIAAGSLGVLAGHGDKDALDVLLHPEKNGVLLSCCVGALKPASDSGNQKAIDALATVTKETEHKALCYMAADGLKNAAASGNPVAVDALIRLLTSTNQSVREIAASGLKMAAANQNAKASKALRLTAIQ